eukprot:Opistho-2@43327
MMHFSDGHCSIGDSDALWVCGCVGVFREDIHSHSLARTYTHSVFEGMPAFCLACVCVHLTLEFSLVCVAASSFLFRYFCSPLCGACKPRLCVLSSREFVHNGSPLRLGTHALLGSC